MARGGNFWWGMVVGAATGAVTALLYAPKPGEQTRHDIQAKARDAGRKAGETWGDVKESASSMARTTQERARHTMSRGKEATEEARGRMHHAVEAGREAAEEKKHELEAQMEEQEEKIAKRM